MIRKLLTLAIGLILVVNILAANTVKKVSQVTDGVEVSDDWTREMV